MSTIHFIDHIVSQYVLLFSVYFLALDWHSVGKRDISLLFNDDVYFPNHY